MYSLEGTGAAHGGGIVTDPTQWAIVHLYDAHGIIEDGYLSDILRREQERIDRSQDRTNGWVSPISRKNAARCEQTTRSGQRCCNSAAEGRDCCLLHSGEAPRPKPQQARSTAPEFQKVRLHLDIEDTKPVVGIIECDEPKATGHVFVKQIASMADSMISHGYSFMRRHSRRYEGVVG